MAEDDPERQSQNRLAHRPNRHNSILNTDLPGDGDLNILPARQYDMIGLTTVVVFDSRVFVRLADGLVNGHRLVVVPRSMAVVTGGCIGMADDSGCRKGQSDNQSSQVQEL